MYRTSWRSGQRGEEMQSAGLGVTHLHIAPHLDVNIVNAVLRCVGGDADDTVNSVEQDKRAALESASVEFSVSSKYWPIAVQEKKAFVEKYETAAQKCERAIYKKRKTPLATLRYSAPSYFSGWPVRRVNRTSELSERAAAPYLQQGRGSILRSPASSCPRGLPRGVPQAQEVAAAVGASAIPPARNTNSSTNRLHPAAHVLQ